MSAAAETIHTLVDTEAAAILLANERRKKKDDELWFELRKKIGQERTALSDAYYRPAEGEPPNEPTVMCFHGGKHGTEIQALPFQHAPDRNELYDGKTRPCWFCRSVSGPFITQFYVPCHWDSYGSITGFVHKPHYACFTCERGWKGPVRIPVDYSCACCASPERRFKTFANIPRSVCTRCGGFGRYMGLNFRVPAKGDKKAWARIKTMVAAAPATPTAPVFESRCRCSV